MDYKFIEQLLERYWECQTTIEEEEILRNFFNQENIPARFLLYKPLFTYQSQSKKEDTLDESFDEEVLARLGLNTQTTDFKPRSILQRFTPLLKAAAVVCFFITIGGIVDNSLSYSEKSNKTQNIAEIQVDTVTIGEHSVAYDDILEKDTAEIQKN